MAASTACLLACLGGGAVSQPADQAGLCRLIDAAVAGTPACAGLAIRVKLKHLRA